MRNTFPRWSFRSLRTFTGFLSDLRARTRIGARPLRTLASRRGGLRRTTDLKEKGTPLTRPGVWTPGNPLPVSTVSRTMRRVRKILADTGYLQPGKRGRLARPTGMVLRQLSVDQIKAYVDRLYSPRCQGRCAGPGCKCCRMHHTGSWNKVAAAFHR